MLLCSPLFASIPTTAITGRVITGGKPAAGVTVTATSKALQHERTTVTSKDGRYFLTALPPGRYEVTFAGKGLQTLTKRVIVELARVARADATLEPNEDEDSVTSTALTVGVSDTTIITSHLNDETLDRLPIRRTPFNASLILPDLLLHGDGIVDDNESFRGSTDAFDAYEEVTVLRRGLTADYAFEPPLTVSRTRSGGEEWFVSLRDTITDDGSDHLGEGSVGGRIVPEKLWLFGSVWGGKDEIFDDLSGALGKLTAQLGAQHNVSALYDHSEVRGDTLEEAGVRYTGTIGARLTNEVSAARVDVEDFGQFDSLFARSTYVLGNHILSAGAEYHESGGYDETGLFVNDRWIANRFVLNLGVRHEYDWFSPRIGASYDLRGDGRHAIIANYGDYRDDTRELTLGYATALGNSGSLRVDALRSEFRGRTTEGAQADFIYSLFDRLQLGANYTWFNRPDDRYGFPDQRGSAWATVIFPVSSNELAVTVLGRSFSGLSDESGFATDLAVRYSLPLARTRLTLAGDVVNLFEKDDWPYFNGRETRFWVRLRI